MPKLKISDMEQQNRRTRAVISHNMEIYGLTNDDLAKKMNCAVRTVQRKRKMPETFTCAEIRILIKVLKLTDEQVVEFIGVGKEQGRC